MTKVLNLDLSIIPDWVMGLKLRIADLETLAILINNSDNNVCKLSYPELQKKHGGLARNTLWYRIKKLEQVGVITRVLGPKSVSFTLNLGYESGLKNDSPNTSPASNKMSPQPPKSSLPKSDELSLPTTSKMGSIPIKSFSPPKQYKIGERLGNYTLDVVTDNILCNDPLYNDMLCNDTLSNNSIVNRDYYNIIIITYTAKMDLEGILGGLNFGALDGITLASRQCPSGVSTSKKIKEAPIPISLAQNKYLGTCEGKECGDVGGGTHSEIFNSNINRLNIPRNDGNLVLGPLNIFLDGIAHAKKQEYPSDSFTNTKDGDPKKNTKPQVKGYKSKIEDEAWDKINTRDLYELFRDEFFKKYKLAYSIPRPSIGKTLAIVKSSLLNKYGGEKSVQIILDLIQNYELISTPNFPKPSMRSLTQDWLINKLYDKIDQEKDYDRRHDPVESDFIRGPHQQKPLPVGYQRQIEETHWALKMLLDNGYIPQVMIEKFKNDWSGCKEEMRNFVIEEGIPAWNKANPKQKI